MKKRKKRKKKIKLIKKPKLPANEVYWLVVSKDKKDVKSFAERGNVRQKKMLKAVINYRLWQIQEGVIDKNFFKQHDIDLKTLNMDIKVISKRKPKKKEAKKVIDLFDFSNVDLKEKNHGKKSITKRKKN